MDRSEQTVKNQSTLYLPFHWHLWYHYGIVKPNRFIFRIITVIDFCVTIFKNFYGSLPGIKDVYAGKENTNQNVWLI